MDARESEVWVSSGEEFLAATWSLPPLAVPTRGVVVFAHGSGSSRHSMRNRFVARELQRAGFATLLLDLLTDAEDALDQVTREHRFDVALLGARVADGVRWLRGQRSTASLPIGLFGASTGAAAALITAAEWPGDIDAVVSRGGRPDLAGSALPRVRAPTLLIVGGDDTDVLELNEKALAQMSCPKEIVVVRGATHLFEEDGALEHAAALATSWFEERLAKGDGQPQASSLA